MPTPAPDSPTSMPRRPIWRSRWWMPAFALFLGALMLGAFLIGGSVEDGLFSFAVMAAVAALFVFGNRSDTLRGLGGPGRDERWSSIDLRATAFAGTVLVLLVIGGFLVEVARGEDGSPHAQMGAVAGLTYIAAVAFLRRRS